MTSILARAGITAFVLCATVSPAAAQQSAEQQPAAGRAVTAQLGGSINNAGVQTSVEVSWLRPLTTSTRPLRSGAHLSAGFVHALTPAQTRAGGWVQYAPLSIFDIRAGAEPSAYFGTFNSLQGFEAYDQPFDPEARKARGGARAGLALRTYLAPTLKLKAGPVAGALTAEMEWWRSNAGAALFYEPTRDTLLKSAGDRLLRTTAVVLYQRPGVNGAMSAGAIHTTSRVQDAPGNTVRKMGALAVREYAGRRFGLPRPKLTVLVARYLEDPSKAGEWTAAAAIGIATGRR